MTAVERVGNTEIAYSDKVLPSQPYFRDLYRDKEPFESRLYTLLAEHSADYADSQFLIRSPSHVGFQEMSSPSWLVAFLVLLLNASGAKNVLEIGTFVGHTAMQFAKVANVTTIEIGPEFASLAQQNFRANGFADRIILLQGNAGELLDGLHWKFDAVFIDGSKQDYLDYTLKAKRLLTPHGMIVIDDVFFHGDALNDAPTTEKGRGCRRLLDHFKDDGEFDRCILPVANGVMILRKKQEA